MEETHLYTEAKEKIKGLSDVDFDDEEDFCHVLRCVVIEKGLDIIKNRMREKIFTPYHNVVDPDTVHDYLKTGEFLYNFRELSNWELTQTVMAILVKKWLTEDRPLERLIRKGELRLEE